MKKAAQVLKEMGFQEKGSEAVKEAFVRHLIKAATGYAVAPGPNERKEIASRGQHIQGEQMSFDFSPEGSDAPTEGTQQRKTS